MPKIYQKKILIEYYRRQTTNERTFVAYLETITLIVSLKYNYVVQIIRVI